MTLYLSLSLWRDISLIWLSILCFIGLVVPLALAYFAVRGMNAALNKTGDAMHKAQQLTRQARIQTDRFSYQAIRPVMRANRTAARWQRVSQALLPSLRTADQSSQEQKDTNDSGAPVR